MSSLPLLRARVRGLFHKDRTDRFLDDEVTNHLELLAADYVRRGMTELEAHRAAARIGQHHVILRAVTPTSSPPSAYRSNRAGSLAGQTSAARLKESFSASP